MSGAQIARIAKDMKANGYDVNYPVEVFVRWDGRLVISDGHHRTAAAIKAGLKTVPVNVYQP